MSEGFDAGRQQLLVPPVHVEDATRDRLVKVIAAVVLGATPEEVAASLESGEWAGEVLDALHRRLDREEFEAHVDVMLAVVQGSVVAKAA